MEFKGGVYTGKHVNMKSEAAEEVALKQDQIKKKHINVIELKPLFSVYFAIKKTLITAHFQISLLFYSALLASVQLV